MIGVASIPTKEALFLLSVAVLAFLLLCYERRATARIVANPLPCGVVSILFGGMMLIFGIEAPFGCLLTACGVFLLLLSPFSRGADE